MKKIGCLLLMSFMFHNSMAQEVKIVKTQCEYPFVSIDGKLVVTKSIISVHPMEVVNARIAVWTEADTKEHEIEYKYAGSGEYDVTVNLPYKATVLKYHLSRTVKQDSEDLIKVRARATDIIYSEDAKPYQSIQSLVTSTDYELVKSIAMYFQKTNRSLEIVLGSDQ